MVTKPGATESDDAYQRALALIRKRGIGQSVDAGYFRSQLRLSLDDTRALIDRLTDEGVLGKPARAAASTSVRDIIATEPPAAAVATAPVREEELPGRGGGRTRTGYSCVCAGRFGDGHSGPFGRASGYARNRSGTDARHSSG